MHVSHVILRVRDLQRSVRFYRNEVGLEVLSSSEAFAFLDCGSIRLALNHARDLEPDRSATEIVLETDDVHATHAAMLDRGVDFRVEPREVMRSDGRALLACDFTDPDGHIWSITGWEDVDDEAPTTGAAD